MVSMPFIRYEVNQSEYNNQKSLVGISIVMETIYQRTDHTPIRLLFKWVNTAFKTMRTKNQTNTVMLNLKR